ncbi:MAG: DUF1634 domain-containing protein [Candidatus Rokuibacteriota bacterium]
MRDRRRDHRLEKIVGKILRLGVIVSALITLVGGVVYLASGRTRVDYHTFQGEPIFLRRVTDIVADAAAFDPRGIMQLGIVLLLATPLARVIFSAIAFAIQRDLLYVVVTVMVFSVLLFSLVGPHLPHP